MGDFVFCFYINVWFPTRNSPFPLPESIPISHFLLGIPIFWKTRPGLYLFLAAYFFLLFPIILPLFCGKDTTEGSRLSCIYGTSDITIVIAWSAGVLGREVQTFVYLDIEIHIVSLVSWKMWRLKVADGGNDPYIYSTNNFVGRQIWEFDPDYGTPEERAEVEAARENFWKNRYQVKPSGDLLWRMQVIIWSHLYISNSLFGSYSRKHLSSTWNQLYKV